GQRHEAVLELHRPHVPLDDELPVRFGHGQLVPVTLSAGVACESGVDSGGSSCTMSDRMVHQALEALVEQVRSLPGGDSALGLPRAAISATPPPPVTAALPPAELRARTGAWFTALGERLESSLPGALARATEAWD